MSNAGEVSFAPLGDRGITITLGDAIDEATNRRVRAITALIDARALPGVLDLVPAYTSVSRVLASAAGARQILSVNETWHWDRRAT